MAKNANCTPRSRASATSRMLLSPLSLRFFIENGKAAPMANRKNGNTRSTHVSPGTAGLNSWVGGGVCA